MISSLHRALGRTTFEFNERLLLDAIENNIREDAELDWKQELPHSKKPGSIDEIAKDLAAMANGSGGTIVYGMKQDDTSAALKIMPLTEPEPEQHLRQIAYSAIRPALMTMTFETIRVSSESEAGGFVLIVNVAPSLESPHLVWTRDGRFRATKRYGAQTVDMAEAEIEHAYRERFSRRRESREQLETVLSDLSARAVGNSHGSPGAPGPHLVGFARPLNYIEPHNIDVSQDEALRVLGRAQRMTFNLADQPPGGTIRDDVSRMRRGRRSWRMSPNDRRNLEWRVGPGFEVSLRQRVGGPELLGDRLQPSWVPATRVERAVRDLVCLASAGAERVGSLSEWEIVATIVWADEQPVHLVVDDALDGYFQLPDDSEPVLGFQTSEAVAVLPASLEQMHGTMTTMATDLVAQGGLPRLYALPNALH